MLETYYLKLALVLILIKIQAIKISGQVCNDQPNLVKYVGNKRIEIINEFKSLSLIRELKTNKMVCVSMCQQDCSCNMVESKNNDICELYNETVTQYLKEKNEIENEFVYIKAKLKHVFIKLQSFSNGLVHYWPMAGSLRDIIGGKDIVIKQNGTLTNDRFGNKNSALRFNHGYGELPSGSYFKTTSFTIMFWIETFSYNKNQNIVDFGNGLRLDNIMIEFYGVPLLKDRMIIYFARDPSYGLLEKTNIGIKLQEWTHISLTYENGKFTFYINSNLDVEYIPPTPIPDLNKERTSNLIGRNNWDAEPLDAILDELKIFNSALTKDEISEEMIKVQPYNILEF